MQGVTDNSCLTPFSAPNGGRPDVVATLAVPADGGCGPRLGPSIGIPSLRARAAIEATSATYVEVFACPADLVGVTGALAPRYAQVVSGAGFAIFRERP